jgi:putative DNA primase/helicase
MRPKSSDRLPPPANQTLGSIDKGWKARLIVGPRGAVRSVVANALIAFRHAPEWQGVLHFNESSLATIVRVAPPFWSAPGLPFTWADEHDVLAAAWLQHQGISVNKEIAGQAVHAVAREHSFHPVRAYLDSLKWDRIPRIDDWLTLFLGVEPSDYARAVGANFLIGGVARVYRPGVKNDTCPILEGPQGALKSTALRTLAGTEFFTDDIAELGSKDSVMQTRGVWIVELGELDAMTRGELSRVKAFMSRQVDRIRPPYGRRVVEAPRECIFAGTVNKDTYLKDETGGRRFWPVKCGAIKIKELGRDRDQLWAEARARFHSGDTWWLNNPALMESAAKEVDGRYEDDPWDEMISEWVRNPQRRSDPVYPVLPLTSTTDFVTVSDILIHCIGKRPDTWAQPDQTRVARSLTRNGFKRYQKRLPGKREWRYSKSPVPPVEA